MANIRPLKGEVDALKARLTSWKTTLETSTDKAKAAKEVASDIKAYLDYWDWPHIGAHVKTAKSWL